MKINAKNRKAQFKIQQTAFMLMGIVLFFILVGIFWLSLKSSSIKKSAANLEQEQAIATALSIAESPELRCTGTNAIQCIDFDKALVIKNTKIFQSLWPISGLEVRIVRPSVSSISNISNINNINNARKECTIENYPSCNVLTIIDNNVENSEYENKADKASASSFVRLCRKERNIESYTYDKCELGEIIIKI